jgi:hypothetical protein
MQWPYRIPCKGSEISTGTATSHTIVAPAQGARTTRASSSSDATSSPSQDEDDETQIQTQTASPQRDSSASPTNVEQSQAFSFRHSSTTPYSLRKTAKVSEAAAQEDTKKTATATGSQKLASESKRRLQPKESSSIRQLATESTAPSAPQWDLPAASLNSMLFANAANPTYTGAWDTQSACMISQNSLPVLLRPDFGVPEPGIQSSWADPKSQLPLYPAQDGAPAVLPRSNSQRSFGSELDALFSNDGGVPLSCDDAAPVTCSNVDVEMGDACDGSADATAAPQQLAGHHTDGAETDMCMLELDGNMFVSPLMAHALHDNAYNPNRLAPAAAASTASYSLYSPFAASQACGQNASFLPAAHKQIGADEMQVRFGGGSDMEWLAASVSSVGDVMHSIFCNDAWQLVSLELCVYVLADSMTLFEHIFP